MLNHTRRHCFSGFIKGLIFLLIPLCGFSQFNLFRNLDVKDGLPSSEIYEMLEESGGYLWFATDMGVSRYNGYEFKNYTTEHGLPDNTVFGIHEDHKHRIWFRTMLGKLAYFKNNQINPLPCNDSLSKLLHNASITSLYVDRADTIWLGITNNCIIKIAPGWNKQQVQKMNLPENGHYIYEIDGTGFIYGGNFPKKCDITIYKKKQTFITLNAEIEGFAYEARRYHVKRLKDHSYVSSIRNWVLKFNDQKIIYKDAGENINICLEEDLDGSIMVGAYKGIRTLDRHGELLLNEFKQFDQKVITSIHVSKENELWVCTKGHGVFYVPYRNFKYYTSEHGLSESSLSAIGVIQNEVVSGHLNGEICFLEKNNVNSIQLLKEKNDGEKPHEITDILDFNTDKKYIGCIGHLYTISPKTKRVTDSRIMSVKKLFKSTRGNLLSLQSWLLKEYDPSKGFKELFSIRMPSYSDNVFQDKSGKVWICSSNGMLTYDEKAGLQNLGEKENKLLLARMADVKQDKNGAIWMVSRGQGVIIKDGNKLTQIKQENGLSSNMCRTIFMDSTNIVWVGTNNGLNKITVSSYRPLKYTVDTYYSENGLLTDEVSFIMKHGNKLWIAHYNGISVVDPRNIKNNKVPPPVYIIKALINGEAAETKNLNALKYSDNYLTITYNGLSYKEPGNIEYKYKMEGMDTAWIHTKYTSLTFNTVQPGSYRFLIYAKNNDGYWSKYPAVLAFTILPPWWKTWTFIILITIASMLLLGMAFKYRLKIIKERERSNTIQQTLLSNAELKALRSQMNPHFVFNAINSVQYFITNNDPASSQKYLSKFAKLIRYVVDNSKPAAIPLSKELEALHLYLDLESLRFENKFEYAIEISDDVDVENIRIPSMLIQPFVENAIWHGLMHKGSKGRINISIAIKEQALICLIEDNGVGRKKSREIMKEKNRAFHKSVGMSITQERLDIINQKNNSNLTMTIIDLEDHEGNSTGTRIELNLPFY